MPNLNKGSVQFVTILIVAIAITGLVVYTYPRETAEAHEPTTAELKAIAEKEAKKYDLLKQANEKKASGLDQIAQAEELEKQVEGAESLKD